MKMAICRCRLLLLVVFALAGCSSQQTAPNPDSKAASPAPEIKTGAAPEFELLNAWKPKTVIVQVYGGEKFTLTAKRGTEFVAVELMMKMDEAAKPVSAAMWGGTVLLDSKGNRQNPVFSYAASLVKYEPHGDTVEYVGAEGMKDAELLSKTLKEAGGKLVVVFGAPEKDPQLKLEIAKTTTVDVPVGGK
jgi:hypothetical protein